MSLNLRAIANSAIQAVNPDTLADWYVYSGSTQAADYTRTPSYTKNADTSIQVQAISGGKGADGPSLEHKDGLNIQGTLRAVWMRGDIKAVSRPQVSGGDVFYFDAGWWLVVQLVETWDREGWTHFIVQLQNAKPDGIP